MEFSWSASPKVPTFKLYKLPTFGADGWLIGVQFMVEFIVIRGDLLGKPANIKVENNGAVVFVGSSLTVHNPLVFVHNLVSKFKMIEMLLNVVHVIERCARSGPKMSYYHRSIMCMRLALLPHHICSFPYFRLFSSSSR